MSSQTGFDADYVKKLREEAASWRTRCRELEAAQHNAQVEIEFARRGIQADPTWVKVEEGQTIEEAVGTFVEQYPHLKVQESVDIPDIEDEQLPVVRSTPKPIAPSTPRSTTPKKARSTRINQRNISEIRKDPKARAQVRDLYRDLLTKGSNQGE